MSRIAVTGATGHIGSRIVEGLLSLGADNDLTVRRLVRDASRAPQIAGTEIAQADYRDGPAVEKALDGVDVVFMVSAHESADRVHEHVTFITAAARAGVRHIVYTSFSGAGDAAGFTLARDHGATEAAIRDSGMEYTFLRDNFYLDVLTEFADQNGVIRGPAGDGVVAAVARADVVDVATTVLLHPHQHVNRIYELTGGEALSLTELARRASAATGKSYSFVNETLDEAYASRAHYGAPDWQVDAWVSTYTAIADGELARVSHDVQAVTGHAPRTLEDVLSNR